MLKAPRSENALRLLLYGGMIVVSLIFQLRPTSDPDFFWHLKNGEWTWQHRALPAQDTFNYTSGDVEPAKQRFILTSYWLSEVIFHLIHASGGFPGILALKFILAALLVLALLKPRGGDPLVHAAITLAVLPLIFGFNSLDRPQTFSFLLFAALLTCLERARSADAARSGWAASTFIPLIMLVWANMHGGHAVGQVTIALYLLFEGVKFLHPTLQPVGGNRYRRLLALGFAGIGASFVNPNSPLAGIGVAAAAVPSWVGNSDYSSSVRFFQELHQPLILIFWGALLLAAFSCLFTIKRPDITRIALLAGTGYQAFIHVRYIPFFVIAAVPFVAAFFSTVLSDKRARLTLVAASVTLAAYFSRNVLPSYERLAVTLRVNEALYPVQAADFILANNLKGNLYNTLVWGGYLLWRLAPEHKVFVDGKGINQRAVFHSGTIALALELPPTSPLYWKNLLRWYGVGYLVLPRIQSAEGFVFDEAAGLRLALRDAPEWVPVFADGTALVYVLNTPEHRDVIARHAIE